MRSPHCMRFVSGLVLALQKRKTVRMNSNDLLNKLPSWTLTCIVVSLACGSAALAQTPTSRTDENRQSSSVNEGGADKDKLQGKWQIVSIAMQGKVIKREEAVDAWKETFANDVIVDGDRFTHARAAAGAARITLDETRDPKQITIQGEEGKLKFRGIYAIQGETVLLCVNGDGTDVRRPEEFTTKEGTPLILITLKK